MIPTSDDQLEFLAKLQRVFNEGDFTATYKFALLIALADLAVEIGHDDSRPLQVSIRQLAEKFVELYWQQAAPYGTSRGTPAILVQNLGSQAAVISRITAFRAAHPKATPHSASKIPDFVALLKSVGRTVSDQPLTYLQNFGGGSDPFLYERNHGVVVMKPGVAYCLRRFQPLVQGLARSHWLDHVKANKRNASVLGDADDLESFLFETSRRTLGIIGAGLRRLAGSRCFYCGDLIRAAVDVDHFVPFSLYPRDLSHNFVLAHDRCNRSKSGALAGRVHLERWIDFIKANDDDLREIGAAAGRVTDLVSTRSVARWAYGNAAQAGANAWIRPATYEKVDVHYLTCLS